MTRPAAGGGRHVLFVDSVATLAGGAERSLLELARGLADRGWTVSLAAWASGPLTDRFATLGRVHTLGARRSPASPLGGATDRVPALRPLVRSINRLRLHLRPAGAESSWLGGVLDEAGATVLHTNCDLSPLAAARAARASGVPWVAHLRDDWRQWLHPRVARALGAADERVVASAFMAHRFRSRGLPARVVPNPVGGAGLRRPIDEAERARLRSAVEPRGGWLVAVVGRLDEQKGSLRVPDVAARLRDAPGPVRFLLAGSGAPAFEHRLRAAVERAGVSERVRLLGHREDLERWLPTVDAILVPSAGEPFGRMIVEGMHAGLPVVAFRDGAAPEILDHGHTGLLAAPGDSAALADAVRSLAADPDRARRIGDQARSAATAYAPDRAAAAMEAVYLQLPAHTR